jgi:hypothetical protein
MTLSFSFKLQWFCFSSAVPERGPKSMNALPILAKTVVPASMLSTASPAIVRLLILVYYVKSVPMNVHPTLVEMVPVASMGSTVSLAPALLVIMDRSASLNAAMAGPGLFANTLLVRELAVLVEVFLSSVFTLILASCCLVCRSLFNFCNEGFDVHLFCQRDYRLSSRFVMDFLNGLAFNRASFQRLLGVTATSFD